MHSATLRRRLRPAMLGLALLLSGAGPLSAQDGGPRIAAVVNEAVITSQDLNDRLNLALATTGAPGDPETRRRLIQQILRGYIDEKLQLQEAARLKLEITEAEIDQAFRNIAQRNKLDAAGLTQALAERQVDAKVLRGQIRGQIAWAKVVNRELKTRVAVSQEQVELALRDVASGQSSLELLVSEILLPVDSAAQESQVVRDATGIVTTLRNGADFASLARQVSVSSSAENGGDLGWLRPDTLLPDLRPRLVSLQAGSVSDPIATPAGVYIFKVRERRSPNEPTKRLVVTRVSLAQLLIPLASGAKAVEVQKAEARAKELSPQLKSCQDVETLARRVGGEGSGNLGWFSMNDLPQPLQQLVGSLPPGRISPPVRSGLGLQLLMVCDREGRDEQVAAPPPPAPPSRDQLRQQLEAEQLDRLATRYLRDLRKDAYIDIRLR